MERKQWLKIIIAVAVPIALFLLLVEQRSWLPRTLAHTLAPSSVQSDVKSLIFSPEGQTFAVSDIASEDVKLWDLKTFTTIHALKGQYRIAGASFSPDGSTVASAGSQSNGGGLNVWDARTSKTVYSAKQDGAFDVAFSPDGRYLAVSGLKVQSQQTVGGTITLRDTQTWQLKRTIDNVQSINSIAFSPDGHTFATSSSTLTLTSYRKAQKGEVRLWDATTGVARRVLPGGSGAIAFSPDGKTLVTGHDDSTVKLWNWQAGSVLKTLKGHGDKISSIAVSSDGKMLASGSFDATVRLWDVATGKTLRTFTGFVDSPLLAFSPDGNTLATSNWKGTVTLWRVR